MAGNQLTRSIPFMTLDVGCTVTIEAIDPTTGAAITGVTVSQVAIYGSNLIPYPAKTQVVPLPILLPMGD